MARTSHPESTLQIQCVTWFKYQYPHLAPLMFAVPNGGSRDKREAAIMKAEGITAGVSDLILNIRGGIHPQLAIEMKDVKGRQSPEQKRYQRYAEAVGIKYIICRSFQDFKDEVTNYLETVCPLILQQLKNIYREEQEQEVQEARRQYQEKCNTIK
jgi:hypothetical protein